MFASFHKNRFPAFQSLLIKDRLQFKNVTFTSPGDWNWRSLVFFFLWRIVKMYKAGKPLNMTGHASYRDFNFGGWWNQGQNVEMTFRSSHYNREIGPSLLTFSCCFSCFTSYGGTQPRVVVFLAGWKYELTNKGNNYGGFNWIPKIFLCYLFALPKVYKVVQDEVVGWWWWMIIWMKIQKTATTMTSGWLWFVD